MNLTGGHSTMAPVAGSTFDAWNWSVHESAEPSPTSSIVPLVKPPTKQG